VGEASSVNTRLGQRLVGSTVFAGVGRSSHRGHAFRSILDRIEHYLLALLETRSIASETLEELGITHERVSEVVATRNVEQPAGADAPEKRGLSPTPDAYGLTGRATAFAATAGARTPRPEHWLLALIWSDTSSAVSTLHHLGAEQTAVLQGLRRRGVPVPEFDPLLYRPWRVGDEIELSEEELGPFLKVLRELHPPGSESRWGFNYTRDEPRRARVSAEEGIDLESALVASRERSV
jgi:hypothetical protein